jgi:hypothetical protein
MARTIECGFCWKFLSQTSGVKIGPATELQALRALRKIARNARIAKIARKVKPKALETQRREGSGGIRAVYT